MTMAKGEGGFEMYDRGHRDHGFRLDIPKPGPDNHSLAKMLYVPNEAGARDTGSSDGVIGIYMFSGYG
jgi:hypothetical protein